MQPAAPILLPDLHTDEIGEKSDTLSTIASPERFARGDGAA